MTPREEHRRAIAPLAEKTYRVEFTANKELHDKLRVAQDLLRHRIPDGDLACIVDRALDLLIADVKKKRFAVGRKSRQASTAAMHKEASCRHIPDAIKREVYERDRGRCTFEDERGRRCGATCNLEFDHLDGFALTRVHDVDRITLRCRPHNQHGAEKIYGRAFMERARSVRVSSCSRTGRGASVGTTGQLDLLEHRTSSAPGCPGLR
ncbi:MAG TPA: hypothetical protein VKB92_09985 [Myxococcales bacterium]|nr:hypothetical protein [Myxococcales bacterium]